MFSLFFVWEIYILTGFSKYSSIFNISVASVVMSVNLFLFGSGKYYKNEFELEKKIKFHENGKISAEEYYDNEKITSTCYDKYGKMIS